MNNEEFAQKNTCCLKKVLVTGASGFIGSFLVEGGLEREMQVWAGVRKSSSRTYLKDPRIQFAELDFAHPGRLTEQLAVHKQLHGGWDYIIHCAGVTKCRHKDEFDKGNYVYTRNFVEALRTLDMVPRQFVYISSLSIFGPIHEDNYAPISERDTAMPNTAYGVSKLKSEHYLQSLNDCAYFVSDGNVYSSRTFSDLIQKELGNPWVIHIKCPLFILKVVSLLAEFSARCLGKVSTLNADKYKIMKQRNWQCDISPLVEELGYRPEYPLDKGVKEIIAWYKKEGWL